MRRYCRPYDNLIPGKEVLAFPQFDYSALTGEFFVPGEHATLAERESKVWQRVCKIARSRPCIVMAMLSTCAVVLVMTLLVSLPPREEASSPSMSERLPEDGNLSPQFKYEGNCLNFLFVFVVFFTDFAQDSLYRSV